MAPEVVKQTSYTSKADIWSVGCLVVEMLTGDHPWANLNQFQAIFRVRESPRLNCHQSHTVYPDRCYGEAGDATRYIP